MANGLSEAQIRTVRQLIERAPDATILSLETALAGDPRQDRSVLLLQELVSAEALDRQVRAEVFGPLVPLCRPFDGFSRFTAPAGTIAALWRGLKAAVPRQVQSAMSEAFAYEPPPVFDDLCLRAADMLRRRDGPEFDALATELDAIPGRAARFAVLLELSPVLRRSVAHLEEWIRSPWGEAEMSIRLAFRDATKISEEAGFLLMETLCAHLEQPAQILRLISVVMDRPTERYLAATELGAFGARLLDEIDRRINHVRGFDPEQGVEAGTAAAASVVAASDTIIEFEQEVLLSRDGQWGFRLSDQKRNLALAVESRLRDVEPSIMQALPTQPVRFAKRHVRGAPKLTARPDPRAVARASALLAFLEGIRAPAGYAGFGSLRAKVLEGAVQRLDQYAEDLIEHLHEHRSADASIVWAMVDVTAEFIGLVKGPKAADIIRRRSAAA